MLRAVVVFCFFLFCFVVRPSLHVPTAHHARLSTRLSTARWPAPAHRRSRRQSARSARRALAHSAAQEIVSPHCRTAEAGSEPSTCGRECEVSTLNENADCTARAGATHPRWTKRDRLAV